MNGNGGWGGWDGPADPPGTPQGWQTPLPGGRPGQPGQYVQPEQPGQYGHTVQHGQAGPHDPQGSSDEWFVDGSGEQWWEPTEAPEKSKALPIALGVTAAVLGVAVLGVGGWLVFGRESGAATDTVAEAGPAAAGWTTATTTSARTSASTSVVPVGSGRCQESEIAADTGLADPNVAECLGDWALVTDRAGSGDGIVLRKAGGAWTVVGSTSGGCPEQSLKSAMPARLIAMYGPSCMASSSDAPARAASAPRSASVPSRVAPTTQARSTAQAPPVERAPAPPPPAPAPPPAPVPPPAPAPAPVPERDVAQDLQDLGNAAGDLLDALEQVQATTEDEG